MHVAVEPNLERLEREEDTDGDKKITVEDRRGLRWWRGDRRFVLEAVDGRRWRINGTYALANLLQELAFARDGGLEVAEIRASRLFERPSYRISRLIRERYWDGLTRRIDAENLGCALPDQKIPNDAIHYFYVPASDEAALDYFKSVPSEVSCRSDPEHKKLRVQVEHLPSEITPQYVASLDAKPGLLALATRLEKGRRIGVPFVVPGGRFNEMYGWDSYFEALGLLEDSRVDLARAMVDNFVYEIRHYGKILNSNRTYYLTRSQPPFLTSMALAVYARLERSEANRAWLAEVLWAAIDEYNQVWMGADRRTDTGLSRYYGKGLGPALEVEPGHFDATWGRLALPLNLDSRELERRYHARELDAALQREIDEVFTHDRCMRESGHDTTYRWSRVSDRWRGERNRCADFVSVDLNSLLHKIELDLARTIKREFGGTLVLGDRVERSPDWYAKAAARRQRIRSLLWDKQRSLFFDYDVTQGQRPPYVAATTFYPLWAWHADDPSTRILTPAEADRLVAAAISLLEEPGGIVSSTEESRGSLSDLRPGRQWDHPNGWAPHQMLVWRGLLNYGYQDIVQRLVYRWLYTITRNAVDYNGTIPEKFDVVMRSHEVFTEYGNVGTEFEYITQEGFGWMNASYQVGLSLLKPRLREKLDSLVPPEEIFGALR